MTNAQKFQKLMGKMPSDALAGKHEITLNFLQMCLDKDWLINPSTFRTREALDQVCLISSTLLEIDVFLKTK